MEEEGHADMCSSVICCTVLSTVVWSKLCQQKLYAAVLCSSLSSFNYLDGCYFHLLLTEVLFDCLGNLYISHYLGLQVKTECCPMLKWLFCCFFM
jgi:hypothetical protein